MSVYAVEWAQEHAPTKDIYELAILSAMARMADHDGCGAYQSVPTLARASHSDEKTVSRRIKDMLQRGLITLGDQRRAAHISAGNRPIVYDIMIPFDWFSASQREAIDRRRAEFGRPPMTREERPPLAPPPPRKKRADAGKPRKKKNQDVPAVSVEGGLVVPPQNPVDNSSGGTSSPVSGGTTSPPEGGLQDPQLRSFNSVLDNSVRPEGAAADETTAVDGETDGRTDGKSHAKSTDRPRLTPVPAEPRGVELVAASELHDDFVRIDLQPSQRRQLETLVDAALLRFPAVQVARYLADKAREARTVRYLLTAFDQYSDAIKLTPIPASARPDRTADAELVAALAAEPEPSPPAKPARVKEPKKPHKAAPAAEVLAAAAVPGRRAFVPSRLRDPGPQTPSDRSALPETQAG